MATKPTAAQGTNFVLDASVLLDYPDIIPNGSTVRMDSPTVDLKGAHFYVTHETLRQLSDFKDESGSPRSTAALEVLKRISKWTEKGTEGEHLHSERQLGIGKFSDVRAPRDRPNSPIYPCGEHNTLAIVAEQNIPPGAIVLANSYYPKIRFNAKGFRTSHFGYRYPDPYKGRRDLTVSADFYRDFLNSPMGLSLTDAKSLFRGKPAPVPNEFFVFAPKTGKEDDSGRFLNIARYDADKDFLVHLEYPVHCPVRLKNAGQAIFWESLMDPKIALVICTGPAGTGKTFLTTNYGYTCCKNGDYIGIVVVPCNIDNGIGYLKGEIDEKLDPSIRPIKDSLISYFKLTDEDIKRQLKTHQKFGADVLADPEKSADGRQQNRIKKRLEEMADLTYENWFENIPIAYARGRNFADELAIFDEFQDQSRTEADTLIKRLAKGGKVIITGDVEQIHSTYLDRENNGLVYVRELLKGAPMVAQISFASSEVVRHPLVRFVAERQEKNDDDYGLIFLD